MRREALDEERDERAFIELTLDLQGHGHHLPPALVGHAEDQGRAHEGQRGHHLLDLEGAVPLRLFNKRLTGYLNLRFHRKSVHKPHAVKAAARALEKLARGDARAELRDVARQSLARIEARTP